MGHSFETGSQCKSNSAAIPLSIRSGEAPKLIQHHRQRISFFADRDRRRLVCS